MPRPWIEKMTDMKTDDIRLKRLYLSITMLGCVVLALTLIFAIGNRVWLVRGLIIGGLLVVNGLITYYGTVKRDK